LAFSLGRDELGLYGREFQVNFKIDNMGENIKQFVAGGVGGMAAVFSGHPLKPACVELGMNDQLACFMSGGLAGSLLWTLGMPGDTMKSKWQTDTGKNQKL